MNICLISPVAPPYGGVANWTDLILKQSEKDSDSEIYQINISAKKRITDGRTLWDRFAGSGLIMIKAYITLRKIVSKQNIDVIHMTTSGGFGTLRDLLLLKYARRKHVPTIYHIHFGRIPALEQKNNMQWRMLLKAMRLATHTLVIDAASYQTVKKYLPDKSLSDIPNPIDLSIFEGINSKNEAAIIYIGWIIKNKGMEELLTAWEQLCDYFDDWKLHLVGPGTDQYLKYLKTQFSQKGVCFFGEVSHEKAMDKLSKSSIFVLPSYTEGFPNSVLEAMALSKPIIATTVGALPEMLENGCGILISPQNVDELKEKLARLMNEESDRRRIGECAKKKVITDYSLPVIFAEYKTLWKQCAFK